LLGGDEIMDWGNPRSDRGTPREAQNHGLMRAPKRTVGGAIPPAPSERFRTNVRAFAQSLTGFYCQSRKRSSGTLANFFFGTFFFLGKKKVQRSLFPKSFRTLL